MPPLGSVTLPTMYRVRQTFPRTRLEDIPAGVAGALEAGDLPIKRGDTVAVGAGSRGIGTGTGAGCCASNGHDTSAPRIAPAQIPLRRALETAGIKRLERGAVGIANPWRWSMVAPPFLACQTRT